MCGRITLRTPAVRLIEMFVLPGIPLLIPRYNIAPTQMIVCVRSAAGHAALREAVMMRWGLIPFWAKDRAIGNRMINARSETVAEKPAFRQAFTRRRCLIPIDGFYEWQKLSGGKKQPWLIESHDEQPFALAGLWESWCPPHDVSNTAEEPQSAESPLLSCSILTTSANEEMQPLHDRMPVILPADAWETWLNAETRPSQLSSLLIPAENGFLKTTPVPAIVNNPRNSCEELFSADGTLKPISRSAE
jgi:putative SOS response-associated peptidase YedK